MTHTLLIHGLKGIAALVLVTGITISAHTAPLYASLSSGQGLMVINQPEVTGETLRSAAEVVLTPSYAQAEASAQLVLGMLLIVLGFFIYGLARTQEEGRPVHITVKPKKQVQWYWLELRL